MRRDATFPQQSTLFAPPAPTPRKSSESCQHPPHAQFRTGNLFTGNSDLVCGDCNATLAPSFSVEESNR
jgi:hypothetical protein